MGLKQLIAAHGVDGLIDTSDPSQSGEHDPGNLVPMLREIGTGGRSEHLGRQPLVGHEEVEVVSKSNLVARRDGGIGICGRLTVDPHPDPRGTVRQLAIGADEGRPNLR